MIAVNRVCRAIAEHGGALLIHDSHPVCIAFLVCTAAIWMSRQRSPIVLKLGDKVSRVRGKHAFELRILAEKLCKLSDVRPGSRCRVEINQRHLWSVGLVSPQIATDN